MNELMQTTFETAAFLGLIAPFVIVGTGTVLGLTLAVSQFMLGIVLGMINMFRGVEDE